MAEQTNPSKPKALEPLLKATDVARYLNISRTQAYRLMGSEIPAVRIGPGIIRCRLCDLEAFINGHVLGER